MLQRLQDDDAGAFAHDEAVAVLVERTRCRGRIVVALRQRRHVGEAADGHRRDRRLGAAADHHVRITVLNRAERIADRVRARGAGGDGRVVRTTCLEAHGDDAGRDVGDEHRDEEGADLALPALAVDVVLLLEALEATDTAPDDHPGAIRVEGALGEPRVRHRLDGGSDRVLRVRVGALRFLPLHGPERIEPLQLARELHGEGGRIELRDSCGTGNAGLQGAPSRRHIVADRRNGPETRDDDPTPHYAPTLLFR